MSAETDYRLRGVSLSDGRAVAHAALAYDHGSGAYGGVSAAVGPDLSGDPAFLGGTAYAGYARRLPGGVTADIGVTGTRVKSELRAVRPAYGYTPAQSYTLRYKADYAEAYLGLLRDNVSVYLYLSPDYLRPGQKAAYAEINAAVHPARRLKLFAHAGLLAPLDREATYRLRSRADVRLGLAVELQPLELQVAWTSVSRRVDYPPGYPQARDAVVVSASAYF